LIDPYTLSPEGILASSNAAVASLSAAVQNIGTTLIS